MDKFDLNSLTKEQIELASHSKTPEELIEMDKKTGVELTIDEAQAYLDELQDEELDEAALDKVAGGKGGRSTWFTKLKK